METKAPLKFQQTWSLALLLQLGSLFLYALLALFYFKVPRPFFALPVSLLVPACLDVAFAAYFDRRWIVPVSALISGLGFFFLLESPNLTVYALGGVAIALGKRFIRIDGRHIFNPSNFGLLVMLYLIPGVTDYAPSQWDSSLAAIALFWLCGWIVVVAADRYLVAIGYFLAFVAASFLRAGLTGTSPFFLAGTAIGIPQSIFTFHMVTDPRTSPGGRVSQLAFGALIGALDSTFRASVVLNAPFLSLAVVCSVWPLWSRWGQGKFAEVRMHEKITGQA